MANKKINELDSRASLSLSDLMAVGDPSTGYLYKTTISDLKTLTGAGVISFNGRFGAVSPAEGDYTLTQLGDVIITSASNGQVLKFNGSNWVNAAEAGETDTLATVTARGNTTTTKIFSQGADRSAFLDGDGMKIGFSYVGGSPLAAYMSTDGSNSLYFSTSSSVDAVKIVNSTGNFLIGTGTDSGYKLNVNGSAYIGSNQNAVQLTVNGAISASAGAFLQNALSFNGTNRIIYSNGLSFTTNNSLANGDASRFLFTQQVPAADSGAGTVDLVKILMPVNTGAGSNVTSRGLVIDFDVTTNAGSLVAIDAIQGSVRFRDLAGTGSRILVADANGVISASTSALSGYVPYTGATANVNLGSNNLTTTGLVTANGVTSMSINVDGNGSNGGALNIKHNATTQVAGAGYVSIGAKDANTFYLYYTGATNADWKSVSLKTTNITNATGRVYEFPNADGTLALTSDIPSLTNYVTLNGTQTISGAKTFSAIPVIDNGSSGMGLRFKMYSSSSFGLNGYMDIAPVGTSGMVAFAFGVSSTATKLAYFSAAGLTDNTAREYTLPNASGTLALTSNLSAYLPLAGGTLTGALGGTTATLSSDLTVNGEIISNNYLRLAAGFAIANNVGVNSRTGHSNISTLLSAGQHSLMFWTNSDWSSKLVFTPSTNRTFTFPDASGTVALTSNIPTVAGVYLPLAGGTMTGKIAGVNLEFSNPSATFVSGGVNNSISTHIIAVPSGSTWSNGSVFAASNNTQFLNFGGGQTIQNGSVVAATVNVNRIAFTAGSSTVTLAQSTGIRAIAGMQMLQQTGGTINGTVSHGASMLVQGVYPTNSANITFTNYYGVLINPLDEWGGVTFGSRYGIYQAGSSDANFFAGATSFASSVKITNGSAPTTGDGLELWSSASYSFVGSYNRNSSAFKDLYLYGADTIFENGGTARLRITSGGNVLIGTATDTGAKLQVAGGTQTQKANTFNGTLTVANNTATLMQVCATEGGTGSMYLIIAAIGGAGSDRIAMGILVTIAQGGSTARWAYQNDGGNMFLTDPGQNGYVYVRQTTGSTQTINYSVLRIA